MNHEAHLHFGMDQTRESALKARYGELLSLADLAGVLRYPSVQAIQKARLRGALRLPMFQIPGRRGWLATARAVATYLEDLDARSNRAVAIDEFR